MQDFQVCIDEVWSLQYLVSSRRVINTFDSYHDCLSCRL